MKSLQVYHKFFEDVNSLKELILGMEFEDHIHGQEILNFNHLSEDIDEYFQFITREPVICRKEISGIYRKPYSKIHYEPFDEISQWVLIVAIEQTTFKTYRHKETNKTSVFGIDDIHKFQIDNCQDFDLWEVDSEIKMQSNDVILVRPFIWHSLEENKLVQIYHIDLDMSETEKN
jgi:hypothetical protein